MNDTNQVWLEVDKTNQAILSYFLEQPTTPSDTVDYVSATKDELFYLNSLEDFILPTGMVATLDDLEAHRERLGAAIKANTRARSEVNKSAPQKPVQSPTKANSKQQTSKKISKSEFMSGFKKVPLLHKQEN